MASGNRTTMRLNVGGSDDAGLSAPDGPGVIYYLKTSMPHMNDISVSGPYKNLTAAYAQAKHNFGAECPLGQSALEDLTLNGYPMGFERISSPINGDGTRQRVIQLIRKRKPDLAAALPCPVWNVIKSKIAMEAAVAGPTGPDGNAVPVTEADILDSFENEGQAREAAQAALREVTAPGDITQTVQNSPFVAAVIDGSAVVPKWWVEVEHDRGE